GPTIQVKTLKVKTSSPAMLLGKQMIPKIFEEHTDQGATTVKSQESEREDEQQVEAPPEQQVVEGTTTRSQQSLNKRELPLPLELHGPYLHGSGFDSINAESANLVAFNPELPTRIPHRRKLQGVLQDYRTNRLLEEVQQDQKNYREHQHQQGQHSSSSIKNPWNSKSTFVSEFGAVTMSSFESLRDLLKPEHWSLTGGSGNKESAPKTVCDTSDRNRPFCTGDNPMAQRNYPCQSFLDVYFLGTSANNENDVKNNYKNDLKFTFQRDLYSCMLGQALLVKAWIERMRVQEKHFGLLLWQLNDIWPSGSWGSIEATVPFYSTSATPERPGVETSIRDRA
ncbi:unnamed protein product, partial [Amoebophrya sp. A25]